MADLHAFDPQDAAEFGLEEAVMIHCLKWWLKHNKANGKNQRDGRTWTYNSYAALAQLFPYWTARKTRRVLDSLVEKGVILRQQFKLKPEEKHPGGDATNWYAFRDEKRFLSLPSTHVPKSADALPETADGLPKSADLYKEQFVSQFVYPVDAENGGGKQASFDPAGHRVNGEVRDPLQEGEDLRQRVRLLWREILPEFCRFFRNPPTGQLARELAEALEYHVGEGRTVTREQVARAVDAALDDRDGRYRRECPRYASALLPFLAEALAPPPPAPPVLTGNAKALADMRWYMEQQRIREAKRQAERGMVA